MIKMQKKTILYEVQQLTIALIFAIGLIFLGYGIGLLSGISSTIDLMNPYKLNITYESMSKVESSTFLLNIFAQFISGTYYILGGLIIMLISIIMDSNKIVKRR